MADTIEDELVALEKQFWQAMKDNDVDAAIRLTDDPCIVAGPQGVARIDRATFLQMLQSARYKLRDFDVHDVQVRCLDDDVAIVAYEVHEEITVDDKPLTIDAADTSIWVRRDGRWLCASHTEALAGDPFGRDRQQAAA
jgi:ketosteroid isomerase-like protein